MFVGCAADPKRGAVVLAACAVGASTLLVFVAAYTYYVVTDPFSGVLVAPVLVIAGLLLVGVVVCLVVTRLLFWPLLLLAPVTCWCVWIYLERPDGIWARTHARVAERFLFAPEGTSRLCREEPRPGAPASYGFEFYCSMGLEELVAFYTNRIGQAGFTLYDYRREDSPRADGYYWPAHTLYYRDGHGVWCCAQISAHSPYHEGQCHVRLQCFMPFGMLNQPGFTL